MLDPRAGGGVIPKMNSAETLANAVQSGPLCPRKETSFLPFKLVLCVCPHTAGLKGSPPPQILNSLLLMLPTSRRAMIAFSRNDARGAALSARRDSAPSRGHVGNLPR